MLKSVGDKLKKAISDALAYPEKKSKPITRIMAIHTPNVGAVKCTPCSMSIDKRNVSKVISN